jgi:hypothetical protein
MAPVLACLVTPVRLDDGRSAPGCLPALVLTGDSETGGLGTDLEHLLSRGWAYAEPPVRLTPIPAPTSGSPTHCAPTRPVLLVPCPPPDGTTVACLGPPPQTRGEWSQRVRRLGRQCTVILAPTVDAHASDLSGQVDHAASLGRILWTTARIAIAIADPTPAPPERHTWVTP